MALERMADSQDNVTFPLKRERLDVYAIRHPFDYAKEKIKIDGSDFSENEFVRNSMLNLRFNEHDKDHRFACFKKNEECRAFLPTLIQVEPDILWDDDHGIDCCFSWDWDGVENEIIPIQRKICAFTVLPERSFGDQYLNIHTKVISNIFACNSNVQIGDIGHLFYNTLYTSKSTQAEDSRNFLYISNGFARTLQGQIEKQQRESNESSTSSSDEAPDFVQGLILVMAGIRAHMASTIISAPMAHLLATTGSRFHLSHETKGLPVAQMEDALLGNEITYYYRGARTNAITDNNNDDDDNNDDEDTDSDENDEFLVWPDSFVDAYMYRSEALENMSAYEFVMKYEVVYKNAKQNENSQTGGTRSSKRYKGGRFDFTDKHPCKGRAHVRQLKHERIPIVYSKDGYTDISLLDLDSESPSEAAKIQRENYARLALLLFYPFTEWDDLKAFKNGNSDGK